MARLFFTSIKSWFRRKWFWLGLGFGLALLLSLALRPENLCRLICTALLWLQAQGAAGVIAYIGLYNLATVLFVPGAVLTLGATVAFALGRYLAHGAVCRRLISHPHFQALDAAVTQSGFKIVLLTRLSPILPL